MSKNIIVGFFGFIAIVLCFVGFNAVAPVFAEIPSDSPKGEVVISVESGDGKTELAKKLLDKKIINNDILFATESKNANLEIYTGDYILKVPAKRTDLIAQIQKQSLVKAKQDDGKQEVSVLFKEGQTLDQYAQSLEKKGVLSAEEFTRYAQNPKNFDRVRFPFLPVPLTCEYGDIKKCAKYYPEGYLYPSTYKFYTKSTAKEVFDKLLKEGFATNVWPKIKDKAGAELDKKMIIASLLEKETGRPITGVNSSNLEAVNKERAIISGIFQNRIAQKMKFQSNPTATYGLEGNLCERTLKSDDGKCYTLKSPEVTNLYNTYQIPSYPIGPISNPSIGNILASLNPEKSDYLFFVSEAGGEMYYASTGAKHSENIKTASQANEKYRKPQN